MTSTSGPNGQLSSDHINYSTQVFFPNMQIFAKLEQNQRKLSFFWHPTGPVFLFCEFLFQQLIVITAFHVCSYNLSVQHKAVSGWTKLSPNPAPTWKYEPKPGQKLVWSR